MSVYGMIKDKFIMKDAWQDWEPYRKKLTKLILDTKPENILIVGAGRCNDFDMIGMASVVESITCIDIDRDSIQSSVGELPQDIQTKIDSECISLTGISEKDMETFCDNMLMTVRKMGRDITTESFRYELISGLNTLKEKLYGSEEELLEHFRGRAFDTVVCCGVHSQLFATLSFFLSSLISGVKEIISEPFDLESELNDMIREMNAHIIPVINNALKRTAAKTLVFGNEYSPDYPVEGALQCIEYIRKHMNPIEKHLDWDFNRAEGIIYDMLIQICIKMV